MNKQAVFAGILTLGLLLIANAEERARSPAKLPTASARSTSPSLTRPTRNDEEQELSAATNCTNYCVKYLGGDLVLANGIQFIVWTIKTLFRLLS